MKLIMLVAGVCFLTLSSKAQNVGVGTTTPAEKLDVNGHIRTSGELKPGGVAGQAGQVLTSNGNGTMQWKAATVSSSGGNANGGWGDCSIYNIDSLNLLVNPNGSLSEAMGTSVSIYGDYAVVGSPGSDVGGLTDCGEALVYHYNSASSSWDFYAQLLNGNAAAGDRFGTVVDIYQNYIIVGAFTDDEGGFTDNGSSTIFKLNTNTGVWENQGKLTNPSAANGDNFGFSVCIFGDYAAVGAYGDDEGGFFDVGSATVFKRNSGTGVWESQGKLTISNPGTNDRFGTSLDINTNYLLVGAPGDDESPFTDVGSIVFFKRNTGTGVWESQGRVLTASPSPDDQFGFRVSISTDFAIISTPYDDNSGFGNGGKVTIFQRNAGTGMWSKIHDIYNPEMQTDDNFGFGLSLNADYIIAAASYDDKDPGITNAGSATIYKRNGSIWVPHQKFTQPIPMMNNYFGNSVCFDPVSKRFIVGAPYSNDLKGAAYIGVVK